MSTAASAVFITMPKYVAISPNPLTKIRPAITVNTGITNAINNCKNYDASDSSSVDECLPRGKKRRLDHLTWEEKVQRKKLKNRVAAQTSRDRKKARMEEMETEIKDLTDKTEILQNKCESLQVINDALLEKNQKLDMELEIMRQQLNDLQQHQQAQQKIQQQSSTNAKDNKNDTSATVVTCAGCKSIQNGSAAGLNLSNGLAIDTIGTTEKEQHNGSIVEDCGALPTLQDLLLFGSSCGKDGQNEEFDASKLEELAETLLADITANMEESNRSSNEIATEIASGTERLSGSVVGTTTECMESSKHKTRRNSNSIKRKTKSKSIDILNEYCESTCKESKTDEIATTPATINDNLSCLSVSPDTVYGNYDEKTNSITIVMGDDTVPVNEAVEEIYSDDAIREDSYIECPTPVASPSQVYLNVLDDNEDNERCQFIDDQDDEDDELSFDPIAKFLRPKRPLLSPLAKSPAPSLHSSATSDHGYESIIGSPTSTAMEHFESSLIDDFAWNNSFNDLFPSLA